MAAIDAAGALENQPTVGGEWIALTSVIGLGLLTGSVAYSEQQKIIRIDNTHGVLKPGEYRGRASYIPIVGEPTDPNQNYVWPDVNFDAGNTTWMAY